MSRCRPIQPATGVSTSRLHPGLRYPLGLPALVGALALVVALGTLGVLSLRNLRRLQPV